MKVTAMVLAAGQGQRMGIKKQFLNLRGRPLVVHSLEVFQKHPSISAIILALPAEDMEGIKDHYREAYGLHKLQSVVAGGDSRQETVANCLNCLPASTDCIVLHDGCRPLVSKELIDTVLEGAREHGAAVPGYEPRDTIKIMGEGGNILHTPNRKELRAVQTPQAFQASLLLEAHKEARQKGWQATDDCSLVEKAGYSAFVVEGDSRNIKVTVKEDLDMIHSILGREGMRTGQGVDIHRLIPGEAMILGGVEIASALTILAHSDGDVLVHAIMDALLGAVGLADIGHHFPDDDEAYANISSLHLLAKVAELIEARGYRAGNIDATIILEKPRLAPYIGQMKENIAGVLKIHTEQIGIKATTAEKLGPIGRGEGIMAQAAVLVQAL